MNHEPLARIEATFAQIGQLAQSLRADPDGHVRRSVEELRAAFGEREPIEPAVGRMLRSLVMLSTANQQGCRREMRRRSPGVDQLRAAVECDLLPALRRIGFEV